MALTFYLLELSCQYIERLTIYTLYTIQAIICDKKQLKIKPIIPFNEVHGTLTIQTKDEQYFYHFSQENFSPKKREESQPSE